MKWDRDGSIQYSRDRQYMVMHATDEWWIAYRMTNELEGRALGEFRSEADAKAICERAR